MSRLTQLILELCPGGVPNEKVGSLCRNISSSKKIKKTSYRSSGKYVIVDQGQDLVAGYTDDEDALVAHGEYVIFGEHTREVKYVDFPFAQGADGIKILKARSGVIPRYLYHALSALNIPNRGYNRHWTIVKDMMVPLPPLPVQEEIVRILDKFTALEAELEAELEARKKQYEYYRDKLLTFKEVES
jgi:type I restriction enzyme S subunit